MEKLGCCQGCSQQPLNEPSTLTAGHMVLRPLGHRLPALPALPPCLPCCRCSFQSFIFLAAAPNSTPFNAARMPHTPHTPSVSGSEQTVPLSLWQEAQNQVNNTTLPSPYVERYRIVSAFFSTAVKVNNPVAAEQQYNIQTQT